MQPRARALALLLALACRSSASQTPARFLLSAYYSAGKTAGGWDDARDGDLSVASNLDAALKAVSFRSELVLSSFNADMVDLQYHYARMLQLHTGYHHLLVLAPDAGTCTAFRAHWGNTTHWPGCGYYKLPGDDSGRNVGDPYKLWLRRYKVAALALERGVNVLLTDLDVVFHRDFYADAKHTALGTHNLLIMKSEVNGGLWYAQNVDPKGPVVWLLHEVVRRGLLVYSFMDATGDKLAQGCTQMDQAWLQYLIKTLANRLPRDTWLCLPLNGTSPQWAALTPPGQPVPVPPGSKADRDVGYNFTVTQLQPPMHAHAATHLCDESLPSHDQAACDRLLHFPLGRSATEVEVASLPFEDGGKPAETVVKVPPFVFGTWESTLAGWDDGTAPFTAAVHLVAYGNSFGEQKGGHNNRWWLIQSHGLWQGRWTGNKYRKTGLSNHTYVGLHPEVAATLINVTEKEYGLLIASIAAAALSAGAVPVIPAVPCSVLWMPRSDRTRYGVDAGEQARFRAYPNGQCYPLTSANGDCTSNVAMPQLLLDGAAHAVGGTHNGTSAGQEHGLQVTWLRAVPATNTSQPDKELLSFAASCPEYAPTARKARR